jgi:hypothetical protein
VGTAGERAAALAFSVGDGAGGDRVVVFTATLPFRLLRAGRGGLSMATLDGYLARSAPRFGSSTAVVFQRLALAWADFFLPLFPAKKKKRRKKN